MNNLQYLDLICFSHLRWNFVYQRPQHLMSRFAKAKRVFFVEEPVFDYTLHFEVRNPKDNIWVIVPHLQSGMSENEMVCHQKEFITTLIEEMDIAEYLLWYYTPMALLISDHLKPDLVIYDCMNELTAFDFAPSSLMSLERLLLKKADIVFTGGTSLYEAKKNLHHNIHSFPSSIDYEHFYRARTLKTEPADQVNIPHPRFGYFGVIDERIDMGLLKDVALERPEWNLVLVGPVVKINESDLPRLPNIHYLGLKDYQVLPTYLAGWDVAMMPFAVKESTRYISPTKTPEYLAGGKPVISTPVPDVIKQYCEVVHFASTADDFIAVAENDLAPDKNRLDRIDTILKQNSWDTTWFGMKDIILQTINQRILQEGTPSNADRSPEVVG